MIENTITHLIRHLKSRIPVSEPIRHQPKWPIQRQLLFIYEWTLDFWRYLSKILLNSDQHNGNSPKGKTNWAIKYVSMKSVKSTQATRGILHQFVPDHANVKGSVRQAWLSSTLPICTSLQCESVKYCSFSTSFFVINIWNFPPVC